MPEDNKEKKKDNTLSFLNMPSFREGFQSLLQSFQSGDINSVMTSLGNMLTAFFENSDLSQLFNLFPKTSSPPSNETSPTSTAETSSITKTSLTGNRLTPAMIDSLRSKEPVTADSGTERRFVNTAKTSPFGKDRGTYTHAGQDLPMSTGTPLKAYDRATIVFAGWTDEKDHKKGWGQYVVLDEGNGVYTLYGHLSKIKVSAGIVEKNQVFAETGNTGHSTGPHLHYEVRLPKGDGTYIAVDPYRYTIQELKADPGKQQELIRDAERRGVRSSRVLNPILSDYEQKKYGQIYAQQNGQTGTTVAVNTSRPVTKPGEDKLADASQKFNEQFSAASAGTRPNQPNPEAALTMKQGHNA